MGQMVGQPRPLAATGVKAGDPAGLPRDALDWHRGQQVSTQCVAWLAWASTLGSCEAPWGWIALAASSTHAPTSA